jgi:hypothetical protein
MTPQIRKDWLESQLAIAAEQLTVDCCAPLSFRRDKSYAAYVADLLQELESIQVEEELFKKAGDKFEADFRSGMYKPRSCVSADVSKSAFPKNSVCRDKSSLDKSRVFTQHSSRKQASLVQTRILNELKLVSSKLKALVAELNV